MFKLFYSAGNIRPEKEHNEGYPPCKILITKPYVATLE